jgi:hypothetical protein
LTANLLLRPSSQPSRDPRRVARRRARGLCPERPRERHSAVLAGPRSTAPPRHASRARCFRPCTGPATLPLTPSVATLRGFGSRWGRPPYPRQSRESRIPITSGPPDPAFPAASSKATALAGSGRLPSNEYSLPRSHAVLFAWRTWDLEEPATGVAARVLVALATATRLPTRFRPRCCRAR